MTVTCAIRSRGRDRRARRRAFPLAAGCAIAVLLAAGCGGADGGSEVHAAAQDSVVEVVPHRGGSLTMARAVQPETLDPTLGQSDPGAIQSQIQIYDQLTEILPGHRDVSPGLATSWDVSSDGRTYTFHLRPATFSDGTPLTSRDVVFTFRLLLDPKVDAGFADFFKTFIASVHADGPSTVVFELSKRTPAFPAYLSFNVPSIVPEAYYRRVGQAGFAKHPIGSGAFKVSSFKPGESLVLERNPHYWRKGLPYLDRVTMNFLPDDNARVLALRSGSAQIADGIPFSQLASVRALADTRLLVKQISSIDFILLNEKTTPALRDRDVRLALNYAVPRADIARTVFAGAAPVANSMIPAIRYWDPDVPAFPYDIARAKRLMAQSSAPKGFRARFTYVAGDSAAKNIGTILQDRWGELGVKLDLQPAEYAQVGTQLFNGDYDMLSLQPTTASSDVPIDDELAIFFLSPLYGAFFTNYENRALAAKVEDVTTNPSETERRRLFGEIQRMAMADPPFVPLVFTPARAAVHADVHGFDYVTTNWFRLDQVSRISGER